MPLGKLENFGATKQEAYDLAEQISKITGHKYVTQFAYGRPRLELILKPSGSADISPRLALPQYIDWLRAYIKALGTCKCKKYKHPLYY